MNNLKLHDVAEIKQKFSLYFLKQSLSNLYLIEDRLRVFMHSQKIFKNKTGQTDALKYPTQIEQFSVRILFV